MLLRLDYRIPGPLNDLLKKLAPQSRSLQWHGRENDIYIKNSVPKPGILQSLFSFHFAVRLTICTLFTRLCEEESTRLLNKAKRSFQ